MKIAFQYGADAVYIAGQEFGLRSAADNFSRYEIEEAIRYAHARNGKIYLAVNAFLHDRELARLPEFLKGLNRSRPDALICSDLGVVKTVSEYSDIPVHISTQASVLNSWHARIWKDLGAKRIVVGRELGIREASILKERTGLEVEMFVHGAMCMAYSGHCSISTYVAKRDSNRGGCIQNCRYRYRLFPDTSDPVEAHFLSSKDLCGIRLLDDFQSAGIDSIKIEGRMKSNLYIASTVRAYSQALAESTEGKKRRPEFWAGELRKIPHRDYTEGSLVEPAGLDSVYNRPKETSHEFKLAGTVLEVDLENRRFAMQAKNKLLPGDTIEIMPFAGNIVEVEIAEMRNMMGRRIEVAQPGNVFWLPWKVGIEARNVARIFRPV
ncbi:MAG: U32 family peptidase [Proteobacteria bacterium]|nr:U32 family peptidase [Pseudomonadota bacterium]